MKKAAVLVTVLLCLVSFMATVSAESATTRIKDIAKVQGVRSNQLVGYGLVMGLNGTGDSNKSLETIQSIGSMLKAFGVAIDYGNLKPKNVAAVMKKFGATDALNFDGGGSSEMVVGGQIQNSPSDGSERPVGSAIIVVKK